jgi:hypothetical protein
MFRATDAAEFTPGGFFFVFAARRGDQWILMVWFSSPTFDTFRRRETRSPSLLIIVSGA